jgi:hypothetical protein
MRVGAGYARVFDRDSAGLDVDWQQSPSEHPGAKRLVIDGHVGVGELQIVHDSTEFNDDFGSHSEFRGDAFDPPSPPDAPEALDRNSGCMEVA